MTGEFFQRAALLLGVAIAISCSAGEEAPSAPTSAAPDSGSADKAPTPEEAVSGLVVDAVAETGQGDGGAMTPPEIGELSTVLFEAVETNDPEDLMDAMAALEDVGGQTAIDTLGLVLQRSQDSDVKIQAIDSLVFLSEEGEVSPHVGLALRDDAPEVRAEAADVAGELLLEDLLDQLRLAETQETDPGVLEILQDTIYEIESQLPEQEAR